MAGFIELIAKIKPKNNGKYPLVDDVDVEMEDGSRLSEAIKKPRIPDGGTEGQILAKKSNTNGDAGWVEPLKTEDIDKKLESKLDKNLGSENSDKVLITDSQGNIITQNKEDFEGGGGTTDYNSLTNKPSINGVELSGNKTSGDLKMYTQEEVDNLLYDKMDKPYKPIVITDDITIEDCLDGYFKIDKIEGNTYQAQETDIVPTPQRPISINSRKTTIIKINPNIFDLEKESDTSNIPDSGIYRSIGQYQLKANTKYIFEWSEATVPAKSTLSFQIQDEKGTVLVSPFTYFNLQADEKKEAGKEVEFTTNESGIIKFAYNCTVATSSTTETYQQYWYTKILKDIVLKEDVEYATEYVELRSLKETINKFDLGLLSQTDLIPDTKTSYRKINVPIKLKPNTKYKIYYEKFMVPALTWMVLNIVSVNKLLITIVNVDNHENNEVEKQSINVAFTSPPDGKIYFDYYVQMRNIEGGLIPQTIETFKEKWFTKYLKNIMITEDSLNQSTYVPPTVRDYKIVDHTNKTSKIVRNVGVVNLNDVKWNYGSRDLNHIRLYGNAPAPLKYVAQKTYCNIFESFYEKFNYSKQGIYCGNTSGGTTISIMVNSSVFNGHEQDEFDRIFKEYINNPNAITLYPLATSIEEPIEYLETDTNEIGSSWQDTISPSPTIESPIRPVEQIDILKTGKNLFDGTYHNIAFSTSIIGSNMYKSAYIKVIQGKAYSVSRKVLTNRFRYGFTPDIPRIGDIFYDKTGEQITDGGGTKTDNAYKIENLTVPKGMNYLIICLSNNTTVLNDIGLQIEQGTTATAYEPYTGQNINITPPQPMYQNDIANVESGEYEYEKQKYVVTGNEMFLNDYQSQAGYYGRYFNLKNGNGVITEKIWCNYLSYILSSWSLASEGCCQNANTQIYLKFSNVRLGITDNTPIEEKRTAFANYLKQLYASDDPLYVVVKVAKTTQPIPEEDLKLLKSLKTEQGVTNIFVGGEVKPTINARYPRDLALVQQQLEQKVLLMSETLTETQANLLLQGGRN